MIFNLKRKLGTWVRAGLLSDEQRNKILSYEENAGGRPWVVYGIVGIGITTLITGIVSVISANWDAISDTFKLLCYFTLQTALGVAFVKYESRRNVWREALLTSFALLFLAGIGLIAQIYHLGGDGWQALTLWLVITLPATLLARNDLLCHLWSATTLITATIWFSSRNVQVASEFGKSCLYASVPLVLTAVSFFSEQFKLLGDHFRKATVVWGLGTFVLVGTIVANIALISFRLSITDVGFLTVPWATLFVAAAACLIREKVSIQLRYCTTLLLLATGLYLTLPVLFPLDAYGEFTLRRTLSAAGFIGIWALAASSAAIAHYKRLFDFSSLIIAARFIVIYFEVFGSLAQTGVGLIISGLVILGIAFVWYRSRTTIRAKLGSRR